MAAEQDFYQQDRCEEQKETTMAVKFAAVFAEFVALALFVFICCGCATGVAGEPGWVQQVSLTFGLSITVLAYTIGQSCAAPPAGRLCCAARDRP